MAGIYRYNVSHKVEHWLSEHRSTEYPINWKRSTRQNSKLRALHWRRSARDLQESLGFEEQVIHFIAEDFKCLQIALM